MPIPSEPQVVTITPALLRDWPLPAVGDSKYGRGEVVVVGGAARTPGAVLLAGLAALRVGAGRLSLAVAESAAVPLAVACPEAGVTGLAQSDRGSVLGDDVDALADDLTTSGVVLVGPGLDHPDHTIRLLRALVARVPDDVPWVLDAFALGVLPRVGDVTERLAGRLVLTPNRTEAERLLDRPTGDEIEDAQAIAKAFGAVVAYQGLIATSDGRSWQSGTGHVGLATSGSGDVLAGALAGLVARGVDADQAACWATYAHGAAGDRLTARLGPIGYLARELLDELPPVLVETSASL